MKIAHLQSALVSVILSGLSICLCGGPPLHADAVQSARMLPDDVLVMVSVESISDVRAALEKTTLNDLYKDPAVKPLADDAEKKIRERIDEAVKEFWKNAGVENPPEKLPYPEGRLVLGVSVRARQASNGGSSNDTPTERQGGIEFGLALLADMEGKIEQVRQLTRSLSAGAASSGDNVERMEVAGVQLDVLVPKEESDDPTISYGLKDNWLVLTLDTSGSMEFTESVVRRVGRSRPGSLGDKPGLVAAARTLGDANAFVFVNTDALQPLITASVEDQAKAARIIAGLGLKNVTGLATAIQIARQKNQDFCIKALMGVNGPKKGIPALLAMPSAPLRLNDRLITRDVVGFSCLNLEPSRLYDGIAKMVGEIMFMDINMMVQSAMAITAGEGGQPPVQLRDEVLAQVAAPLFVTWKAEPMAEKEDRTLTVGASIKFLVGASVRDASRLDTGLGRIHQALLRGMADMRRELLDHTIYLLPIGISPASPDESAAAGASPPQGRMAFSVADDTLVMGPLGDVEQAIRSLQGQPDNSIASDPMFRYARKYLPSQAGSYYYRNNRLDAENAWKVIKQMARELSTPDQDASERRTLPTNPIAAALRELSKYTDLSRLPEFREIEEYWGATIGFMQDRPNGLYWESTVLKPARQ